MHHPRYVPPDPARGDANTIGGYRAVHDRPAAFEGPDGLSYSVEIVADRTSDPELPWGAFLLFVRWHRTGQQGPAGHIESDFLARGRSEHEVLEDVARLPLAAVKTLLDSLVVAAAGDAAPRRWWDAMRDDEPDSA